MNNNTNNTKKGTISQPTLKSIPFVGFLMVIAIISLIAIEVMGGDYNRPWLVWGPMCFGAFGVTIAGYVAFATTQYLCGNYEVLDN